MNIYTRKGQPYILTIGDYYIKTIFVEKVLYLLFYNLTTNTKIVVEGGKPTPTLFVLFLTIIIEKYLLSLEGGSTLYIYTP